MAATPVRLAACDNDRRQRCKFRRGISHCGDVASCDPQRLMSDEQAPKTRYSRYLKTASTRALRDRFIGNTNQSAQRQLPEHLLLHNLIIDILSRDYRCLEQPTLKPRNHAESPDLNMASTLHIQTKRPFLKPNVHSVPRRTAEVQHPPTFTKSGRLVYIWQRLQFR